MFRFREFRFVITYNYKLIGLAWYGYGCCHFLVNFQSLSVFMYGSSSAYSFRYSAPFCCFIFPPASSSHPAAVPLFVPMSPPQLRQWKMPSNTHPIKRPTTKHNVAMCVRFSTSLRPNKLPSAHSFKYHCCCWVRAYLPFPGFPSAVCSLSFYLHGRRRLLFCRPRNLKHLVKLIEQKIIMM